MKTDIRIVSIPDDRIDETYAVMTMLYDEHGSIVEGDVIHFHSDTMEECLAFIDDMYKASLKPVLVQNRKGEYE